MFSPACAQAESNSTRTDRITALPLRRPASRTAPTPRNTSPGNAPTAGTAAPRAINYAPSPVPANWAQPVSPCSSLPHQRRSPTTATTNQARDPNRGSSHLAACLNPSSVTTWYRTEQTFFHTNRTVYGCRCAVPHDVGLARTVGRRRCVLDADGVRPPRLDHAASGLRAPPLQTRRRATRSLAPVRRPTSGRDVLFWYRQKHSAGISSSLATSRFAVARNPQPSRICSTTHKSTPGTRTATLQIVSRFETQNLLCELGCGW